MAIRSGVTSGGIVISSAFGGTSSGNSSLTKENMSEVFPTPALKRFKFNVNINNNKKLFNK